MPKALDLTGKRFGKLIALSRVPSRNGKTYWLCQCDCGNQKEVQTNHLTNGSIQSCGCLHNNSNKVFIKICKICGQEFSTHANNRLYCYECSPDQKIYGNEYQKIKARAIKHQLIIYKGGKCEKCGYNKCEGALQFHHLDPSQKDFTIAQQNIAKDFDITTLYKEIDKCILLCANCHAEEHWTK